MPSKRALMIMLMIAFPLSLAACDNNDTAGENLGESMEDAGDAVNDAAEDAGDAMEEAGEDMQDSIDDATN